PPRIVIGRPPPRPAKPVVLLSDPSPFEVSVMRQDDAIRHFACCNETPECNEQLARQRHDHPLARVTAPVCRPVLKPLSQGAAVLEPQNTPRQSDHAGADASVTGAARPFSRRRLPLSSGEPVRPA